MDQQHFALSFQDPEQQRLDHFLVRSLPQFSRARLQGLIKNGCVSVDGVPAGKSGQLLSKNAAVEVNVPASMPTDVQAENIPLDVIFENSDVMVVDKPAGLVVHPAAGHLTGTLVNAALGHDPDMEGVGGEDRPGVVHRLDKDTSGVILLAKNDRSLRDLQRQFRNRVVEKTYLALVDGRPPTASGRVEAPIGRDPSHRKQMAIVAESRGRLAMSEYRTLESFAQHTLLELHPSTGRTHQIRLHCAFLGCPIVGDTVYGKKKPSLNLGRHFLHAAKLKITLPGEDIPREFVVRLPDDLEGILQGLRTGSTRSGNGPQEIKR